MAMLKSSGSSSGSNFNAPQEGQTKTDSRGKVYKLINGNWVLVSDPSKQGFNVGGGSNAQPQTAGQTVTSSKSLSSTGSVSNQTTANNQATTTQDPYTSVSATNRGQPSGTTTVSYGNGELTNSPGGGYYETGLQNTRTGAGTNISGTSTGELTDEQLLAQMRAAVNEAKQKQEASKASALGYYDEYGNLVNANMQGLSDVTQSQLDLYNPLYNAVSGLSDTIISPEQQQQLLNQRKDILSASGQNAAEMFSDPYSGVQTGDRLNIAMNTAQSASLLPIQTQLEVGQANRAAALEKINALSGVTGSMAGLTGQGREDIQNYLNAMAGVASGKSGIQQNYQYDPGLAYIQALGEAMGKEEGTTVNVGGESSKIDTRTAEEKAQAEADKKANSDDDGDGVLNKNDPDYKDSTSTSTSKSSSGSSSAGTGGSTSGKSSSTSSFNKDASGMDLYNQNKDNPQEDYASMPKGAVMKQKMNNSGSTIVWWEYGGYKYMHDPYTGGYYKVGTV